MLISSVLDLLSSPGACVQDKVHCGIVDTTPQIHCHIKADTRQCLFSTAAVGMYGKFSNDGRCWLDTAECGIIWFVRQPHKAKKADEKGRSVGKC